MTTIDEKHQPDDAELDAFLQGEGGLSPRLKRLSQPSPPAEVTAAVMAEIEAALMEEKNAASDATGSRYPRRSSRWAMPLAFAASVLVGVMVHLQWRAMQSRNAAVAQAPAETPLRPSVPENKPATNGETLAAAAPSDRQPSSQTPHAAAPQQPVQVASIAAPTPKIAPPVRVASASPQSVTVTGIRASLQQSLNVKKKSTSVVEVIAAEDVGKMPDKNVADSLQRLPGTSISDESKKTSTALEQKRNADSHIDVITNDDEPELKGGLPESHANAAALAPVAAAPSTPAAEETGKAKAWLDRIEKKIDLGEEREALEEWTKFRKAYPDFAVPDKLTEKIKALQHK